ncbi:MAG: hypothetical protein AAF264_13885 [Pseudomonadota bacterium]
MPPNLPRRSFNALALAGVAGGLAACEIADPLERDLPPMGDFRLGFTIVVPDNVKKVPPSRNATQDQLKASLESEIDRRFRAYDGAREYHIAVAIDGYALAPPGIPVVLTPKSIMAVTANVWTADPQEKVLGPEQIAVFEGVETLLLGSGLVKNAEEQLQTLSRNTAFKIQTWMTKNGPVFGLPER